MSDFQDDQNLQ